MLILYHHIFDKQTKHCASKAHTVSQKEVNSIGWDRTTKLCSYINKVLPFAAQNISLFTSQPSYYYTLVVNFNSWKWFSEMQTCAVLCTGLVYVWNRIYICGYLLFTGRDKYIRIRCCFVSISQLFICCISFIFEISIYNEILWTSQ